MVAVAVMVVGVAVMEMAVAVMMVVVAMMEVMVDLACYFYDGSRPMAKIGCLVACSLAGVWVVLSMGSSSLGTSGRGGGGLASDLWPAVLLEPLLTTLAADSA